MTTPFFCSTLRIWQSLLLCTAKRDSRVTATVSTSPLRTARSIENKPGRQKELALAHSQLWPTTQYPLQVAHSRSSFSCCSRIQPDTREEKYIFFLVFHFTSHLRIVIRKNHPVPATRLDPTALDTESVHTVLQQRCKQSFQFRSATM